MGIMSAQLELDEVDRLIGNKRVVHHRNELINKISSPETEQESWTKLLKSKGAILGLIMVITVNIVAGLSFYFIDKKIPLNYLPSTLKIRLLTNESISLNSFTYFNDKENTIVAYKHAKKFYMKSDEHIGELKVYESSLANAGPCLYVKKSAIMENTKSQLSKLINKQIKFYGKKEKATLLGCFVSTVRNIDNEICVNALVNNKAMLIPVKDLFGRVSKLTAVLQSGKIKRVNDDWLWLLTVKEIKLDDVEDGKMAYFKRTEPQIKFLA
ncbi:hypothetical protein EB796_025083 [Bugula neritina]|uniref:Uncharacterized protein n=1 Tax=Bugula neritina TaxID=10212 RepID=A0A7J7IRU3_BUGNE|nr:hypothetical protein EB796_025083 [Bugula neritina]